MTSEFIIRSDKGSDVTDWNLVSLYSEVIQHFWRNFWLVLLWQYVTD